MNDDLKTLLRNDHIPIYIGNTGIHRPTIYLTTNDIAESTYIDLLNSNTIRNIDILPTIAYVYHRMVNFGINKPEEHYPLFRESFKYMTVSFVDHSGHEEFGVRAYNALLRSDRLSFDKPYNKPSIALSFVKLLNLSYDELLTIKNLGQVSAKKIRVLSLKWCVRNNIPNLIQYPLFQDWDQFGKEVAGFKQRHSKGE